MIVSTTKWDAVCDACGNAGVRGEGTRDALLTYLRREKWLFASNRCICPECLHIYEEVQHVNDEHCLLLELNDEEVQA